jgi:DNA-binding MarR family transcriptional regulator
MSKATSKSAGGGAPNKAGGPGGGLAGDVEPVRPAHAIDLDDFLPYRIHRLAARLGYANAIWSRAGAKVRVREWRPLVLIGAMGALSNSQISNLLDMDAATVSRAIKTLAEQGLVESRPSPVDRRKTLTAVTQKGAQVHDEIAPGRLAFAEAVESCLSAPERVALFALLDKIDAQLADMAEGEGAQAAG